jgi:succinoglycan biosynthesis transport protein ExoP
MDNINSSAVNVIEHQISAPTVSDALSFVTRRKALCVGVAIPILLGAILLAYKLPPIYRSEASILIEQAAVPGDIVASSITSYVDEQIQVVTRRVLVNDNASKIIERHDLYATERESSGMGAAVNRFKNDFYLESVRAEVYDQRRGRTTNLTFMFILGFQNQDPLVAQEVTQELTQLYLDENARSRIEKATETTAFLQQESDRLAQEIAEMELRMAEFKDQHASALPGQTTLNVQTLDRTERDLASVEQEIRELRSQRQILISELRTINPYATALSEDGAPILGTDQRLAELRRQYLELSARYSPEHPDVVRTKREIDAIVGGGSFGESSDDIQAQIEVLTIRRDQLLDRYSAEHPDVQSLQSTIDDLKNKLSDARSSGSSRPGLGTAGKNPEYLQYEVQIETVTQNLAAAESRRAQLIQRREDLVRDIAKAPRTEQEWLALNRGYDSATAEFNEIKRRATESRLSERLEAESKGQRFTLLSDASLPSEPIEPNRTAIIFLGAVLALGAGIGLAALFDAFDTSIRSARDLDTHFGIRPLATIPVIDTRADRKILWTKRAGLTGLVIASVIAVALII